MTGRMVLAGATALGVAAGWIVGSPLLAVGPVLMTVGWRHWRAAADETAARRHAATHTVRIVDDLIQQLKAGRSLAESLRALATVEGRLIPALPSGPTWTAGLEHESRPADQPTPRLFAERNEARPRFTWSSRVSSPVPRPMPSPLAPVLARMGAALDAGTGLEAALHRAAGWVPAGARTDPGLALMFSTLLVLVQRGGPALPALERLSDTLRSGQAVDDETRVQASQATASAVALAGLPLLFVVGLALLDSRLARFYLFQPLGAVCLAVAGVLSYIGWWWMHRIITSGAAPSTAQPTVPSTARTRLALAAVAAVSMLALAAASPVEAALAAAAAAGLYHLRRRARSGDRARALLDAAPPSLDLCAVVLGAGGTIADAVAALATSGPAPVRSAAAAARERAAAGQHLDEALRWLRHELGPGLQPLTGSLLVAEQQGGPMGLTLSRLAAEASSQRRRLGEMRARRLPVLLLMPLVTCALPAVLVGAVMPLAVTALGRIQL